MASETERNVEDTVILARLTDPVEAGALRAFLEAEGMSVSTPGLQHRAIWGVLGGYIDILVRVPKADLERAQGLYAAFRDRSAPAEGDAPRTDRLRRVAVFASIFMSFGCGHFYARRWRAGFALLGVEAITLGLAMVWPLFWYAIPGIIVADLMGSTRAIRADQRGEAVDMLTRLAPLIAILFVAAIPMARVLAPSLLASSAMVSACTRVAQCENGEAAEACVARAADRAFEGRSEPSGERACAECLAENACDGAARACGSCAGLVTLPVVVDHTPGPVGTSADDMQLVVPQLFRRDDERQGMPEEDLDALMRSLEEPPPSR